jgi:predicted dehydrogenase
MKLGILGFAHSHINMYLAEWRKTGAVELTAGWDHDVKRAEKSGIPVCATIPELLAKVEAVVIAAETSRHADLVEQAAAAGKKIILQKPLALTLAEADRMAWQMRVDPHNRQLKALLPELGRIYMVRRRHGLPTQTWPDFAKSWHVNPELNRDIFADDAAHPIDFLYWLRGMPRSVSAELSAFRLANDTGIAVFRYADGSLGEVSCSFLALAGENVTEVIGERGVIIQNYGDVPSCNCPRPPGAGPQLKWFLNGQWHASELPEIKSHSERIAGLAAPLAEFLHGKRPPIATAEEGRDVLRLVLACYESTQQGKRIEL